VARLFSSNDACDILLHEPISRKVDVYEAHNESLLVSASSINIFYDFPAYPDESKDCFLYVHVNTSRKLLHCV
jgi:hypothetical protein